jgi:hypothetical protein
MTDQSRSPLVKASAEAQREFLFEYRFGGSEWCISIFADDAAEAREKIKAVGMARYKGEVHMTIPASMPGAGLFVRALCWWRNR